MLLLSSLSFILLGATTTINALGPSTGSSGSGVAITNSNTALGGCNSRNPCPIATPCCSEYGFCGTGHFCLGGCNPLGSNTPSQCIALPVCQNAAYTFNNQSRLVNSTIYNNDPSVVDFTIDEGTPLITNQGQLVLTMTEKDGGTKVSSARSILYGNIIARIKTGKWSGVVTAFITMSGVFDEIDWEFPGNRTNVGQTNYYYEGDTANFTHGGTANLSNSFEVFHDYGINWTPDSLTWTVDGNVVRTLLRSNTLNPATGIYEYPNTPARVQLSIWPGGLPTNPPGTIEWAGGLIDWTNSDYLSTGYYYALVQSVTITCFTQGLNGALDGYNYGANGTMGGPSVSISGNGTQIFSNGATGLNMLAGKTSGTSRNATQGIFSSSASPSPSSSFSSLFVLVIAGAVAMIMGSI